VLDRAEQSPLGSLGNTGKQAIVRSTALLLIGALAAVAAVAFYLVLGAPAPGEIFALFRGEQRIAPGFIGVANFGHWRLICLPGPATLDGLGAAAIPTPADPPRAAVGNSCRINQEIPAPEQGAAAGEAPGQTPSQTQSQTPKPVIVAANFSLVGPKHMPAAMLRLPPTAQVGDVISLRFDERGSVQTTVRDCAATECLAAGTLTTTDWAQLSGTQSLQVAFPAAGRQWVLLNLPVEGLSEAIEALNRAEISSAH
jgi:hypothetical protein